MPVIWGLACFMGAASAFGDEAAYYRQKAEQAFADQRYLQAASFAAQALSENRRDRQMHILLILLRIKWARGGVMFLICISKPSCSILPRPNCWPVPLDFISVMEILAMLASWQMPLKRPAALIVLIIAKS